MIEPYSIAGYEIVKMEEVVISDIAEELMSLQAQTASASVSQPAGEAAIEAEEQEAVDE